MASGGISAGSAFVEVLPRVSAGFASGISSQLSGPIAKEGEKISAALGKSITIGKAAAVAGFAAIGAAAVHGLSEAVHATENFGEQVYTLKRGIGSTAEEASKLVVLGQHFGITVDKMAVSFGFFAKQLVNGGTQIKRYGIELNNADGTQKSFSQLLGEVADQFVALPTGVDKAAFAMNVFGRSGRNLLPILALGSKGIEEVEAAARKYGLVLSGSNLEAIHEYALAQNNLNLASQGLKVTMGTALIPILTKLDTILTEGVVLFGKIPGPVRAVGLAVVGLVASLTALGIVVGIVRTAFGNLGISLGSLGGRLVAAVVGTQALAVTSGEAAVAMEGEGAAAVLASRSLLGLGVAGAEGGAAASLGLLGVASAAGVAALAIIPVAAAFLIERGAVTAASRAYFAHTAAVQANTDAAKDDSGVYSHLLGQYAKNRSELDANAGATQALTAAQNTLDTGVQNLTRDLYSAATAALAERDAMLGLQGGLLGVVDSARGFTQANQALSAAEKAVADDIANGRKGTQQYRDDLAALTDAKYADVHANFSLKQSIAAYGDQLLGPVKTAQDAVAASLANLSKVQGDAKASATDLADAQDGVTAAQDALAAAEKGLAPQQQHAIAQLDAMFRAAGFTKSQIADLNAKIYTYIGRIKGIPKAASTNVTAPGLSNVLSLFQSLYGTIYKIKRLGGIQIPVGGGAGVMAKGGAFSGYAGGAVFASPGGHLFQAGEGNYPTPLGKGGEIVNEKGVMPLDAHGRAAILDAVGISPASIKQAFKEALWEMRGSGGGGTREIVLRARGRDLVATVRAEELWGQ